MNKEFGTNMGFAFVQFEKKADAEAAIEKFDGFEAGNKKLKVPNCVYLS